MRELVWWELCVSISGSLRVFVVEDRRYSEDE